MSLCASHIPAFMHDETPIPVVPPTDCVVCVEEPTVLHVHPTVVTPIRRRVVSSRQERVLVIGTPSLTRAVRSLYDAEMLGL